MVVYSIDDGLTQLAKGTLQHPAASFWGNVISVTVIAMT